MGKVPKVTLMIQCKVDGIWKKLPAPMSANGRPKYVPGTTFYLRYKRNCWEPVGKDPDAANGRKAPPRNCSGRCSRCFPWRRGRVHQSGSASPMSEVIDLKQQFALLHKLIVADVQAHDRPFHLRRESNEIGCHFRVVRARLVIGFEKHNQTQNHRGRDDGYTQVANCLSMGVLFMFQLHKASSVKKKKPQCKGEQSRQAGIHHDWRRERFFHGHAASKSKHPPSKTDGIGGVGGVTAGTGVGDGGHGNGALAGVNVACGDGMNS
jgi:hypothetical protein